METNKGLVKGEARNITVDGVYIHFNDPMVEPALNEPFRLVIDTPQGKIGVVGKAVWSKLDILADLVFALWTSVKKIEHFCGKQFRCAPRSEEALI
jgi:hypothetical protein